MLVPEVGGARPTELIEALADEVRNARLHVRRRHRRPLLLEQAYDQRVHARQGIDEERLHLLLDAQPRFGLRVLGYALDDACRLLGGGGEELVHLARELLVAHLAGLDLFKFAQRLVLVAENPIGRHLGLDALALPPEVVEALVATAGVHGSPPQRTGSPAATLLIEPSRAEP